MCEPVNINEREMLTTRLGV